jgi:hypothetical protein
MPTEEEQRVVRRFGIAVVVAFGLATALPFAVASITGGKPDAVRATGDDVAKSARVAVARGAD